MTDENLTPEEHLTRAEGEKMLDEVIKNQQPKQSETVTRLVGADGEPISKIVVTDQETDKDRKKKQALEKREAFNKTLKEIAKRDPKAEECLTTIVESYKLLFWSLNELATFEGMNADVISHVSEMSRAVAMQGFSLPEVTRRLKHNLLPYLQERTKFYVAEKTRRETKMKRINNRLKGVGIALPGRSLSGLFMEKPFKPGLAFVVHGPAEAVREALKLISVEHMTKNLGAPTYLSSQLGENKGAFATTVMPLAWWKNAARELSALESAFESVVESESLLLLVEDLEMLYPLDDGGASPQKRKGAALAKIYSWAFNHMVALVIGDVNEEDVPTEAYGGLPHVAVRTQVMDGVKQVVIGNDVFPVFSEK